MLEKADQRKVRTAHTQAEAGSDTRLDPAWNPPPSATKILSPASSLEFSRAPGTPYSDTSPLLAGGAQPSYFSSGGAWRLDIFLEIASLESLLSSY